MYPVCPASGEYALGAPRFDRIVISLPDSRKLSILANGASIRKTFTAVSFGESTLARPFVRKDEISHGGAIVYR